jgi:hypothetical protein
VTQCIIDNRPGASSKLGTEAVVKAPPDGYALLMVSTSRPGGRQIDNEIELGRLLDWNVGRLRPAQNRRASDQLSNSYRLFVRLKDTA